MQSHRLVALVVAVCGAVALGCAEKPAPDVELTGVTTYDSLAQDHVETDVVYAQTPPVGGTHNPRWQNCGVYDQPIRKELGVHSLEHGAVWITYRPDLPAGDVAKLRALVAGRPYTLMSPYPDLPGAVYASAWGLQLKADSAADPRIPVFIKRYTNGTQTPEPGAPCIGGIGLPTG